MNDGTHDPARLVFIASLGRSGSTLLDLLLGAHPRIVGLGEVWKTLKLAAPEEGVNCTCGVDGYTCPIWGEVIARRRAEPDLPMADSYRQVIARARDVAGPEVVLVDSSKDLPVLRQVTDIMQKDFRVLFLLKDVRGYASSLADADGAPGETFKNTLRRSNFLRALQWYQRNRAFAGYLRESGLDFMQLGYEELCFRSELILGKICDFAGVPFDGAMLSPTTSNSHILRGNPMRWDPTRRKAIIYDNRWFYRPRIQMLAAALPFVFSWNTDNVYRNIGPAAARAAHTGTTTA